VKEKNDEKENDATKHPLAFVLVPNHLTMHQLFEIAHLKGRLLLVLSTGASGSISIGSGWSAAGCIFEMVHTVCKCIGENKQTKEKNRALMEKGEKRN
jgi:hypothetical protein